MRYVIVDADCVCVNIADDFGREPDEWPEESRDSVQLPKYLEEESSRP